MTEYPIVLMPQSIRDALAATPQEPPKPEVPPEPILKLTPQPQAVEEFTKVEPKRGGVGALIAGGAGIALLTAFLGSMGFLVGGLALGGWVLWYYKSYGKRLNAFRQEKAEHEEKVRRHESILRHWERKALSEKKKYEKRLEEWKEEIASIERIYQQQTKESLTPEAIKAYRNKLVRSRLLTTQTYHGTGSNANKGYAEHFNNCSFGTDLKEYFPNKIHIELLISEYGYTPDFAYIDEQTGLHIDIEIDEPYTPRQYPKNGKLKLTHCMDGESGSKDTFRDSIFEKHGWVVIRFSEQQVLQSPQSCCKQVAEITARLLDDNSITLRFHGIPDLEKMPRWSENTAKQMASDRARLSYTSSTGKKLVTA